ncbi:hypothetical protein ES708_33073 [subsurface metagenome]
MKAREKIYDSVKDMNPAELGIVYEQIRLIKRMKSALPKRKHASDNTASQVNKGGSICAHCSVAHL